MPEFTPPPLSDEDARRQRQEALSALARSHLGVSATPSPSSQRHVRSPEPRRSSSAPGPARRRPLWIILGSLALVLILVAGIVLHQVGLFPGVAAKSHTGSNSVLLVPATQGQDCLENAAWSPDGKLIAVIGYNNTCPSDFPTGYNYQAGILNVYSAATGQLVQTILPDPTVLALPGVPAPPADVQPNSAASVTNKAVINYQQVLWSPDGKQLALTFQVGHWINVGTRPNYIIDVQGLVLVNADGTHERVAIFTGMSQQIGGLIWNTVTDKYVALPAQVRYGDLVSLPPAMSYSWSSQGQLTPGASINTSPSSPSTPTGNPDGGSSFTIWQPGVISMYTEGTANSSPVPIQPAAYSWNTSFAAWSPDGDDLFDSFSLLGVVEPQGASDPTPAGLQALGWVGAPNVAIHDLAEQQLLLSLHATISSTRFPVDQDNIAWSPNGRVLASVPEIDPSNGNLTSLPVTLYDSATGSTLLKLQPRSSSQISSNEVGFNTGEFDNSSFLRWSADGSHVLVYSIQLDTITIWGPGSLPGSSRASA